MRYIWAAWSEEGSLCSPVRMPSSSQGILNTGLAYWADKALCVAVCVGVCVCVCACLMCCDLVL